MIAGPDFHSPEIHHLLFGFYLECASIWVVKLKNKRNKYFLSSFGTSLESFMAATKTIETKLVNQVNQAAIQKRPKPVMKCGFDEERMDQKVMVLESQCRQNFSPAKYLLNKSTFLPSFFKTKLMQARDVFFDCFQRT